MKKTFIFIFSMCFAAMMAAGGTQAQDFSTPTENDVVPEGFVLTREQTDIIPKNVDDYKFFFGRFVSYNILSETDSCEITAKTKGYESGSYRKDFYYFYAKNRLVLKQLRDYPDKNNDATKSFYFDLNGNLISNTEAKYNDTKGDYCGYRYFSKDGKKYATETKKIEYAGSNRDLHAVSQQLIFTNHIDGTEVSIVYKKGDVLLVEEKRKDGTKKSYRHLAKDKDIAKLLDDNVKFYKSKFPEADWEWLK